MSSKEVSSNESTSNLEATGTILRLKRKRTVESHCTLLLHGVSKKQKTDQQNTEGKFVFHLVGTVGQKQYESTKTVVKNFREKGFHHEADINVIKENSRAQNKGSQNSHRYKILSKLREDFEKKCSDRDEVEAEGNSMQIFDIEQEVTLDDIPTAEDLLLCNSAKMIREKLNLYDESQPDEYVYDVYYAPDNVDVKDDQFLELEEFYEELVHEIESDVDHDDSDDENAEDNWRNDYPDEDYYSSDEAGDRDFGIPSSDDEDDYVYQGYREGKDRFLFDPFGHPDPVEDFDHSISDTES